MTYFPIPPALPAAKAPDAWVLTFTGRTVHLNHPSPDDIDIRDIAHHLSLTCRFGGACKQFYSVARHSLLVCDKVSPEHQLWGLLHDAAEAYIGDIVRPLKHDYSPELHGIIHRLEDNLLKVIAQKFGLPWPIPQEVMQVDNCALATEMRDLVPPLASIGDWNWQSFNKQVSGDFDWHWTERNFLARFRGLFC